MSKHFVFVYGTLKSGWGNHDSYMADAKFIKDVALKGVSIHTDEATRLPFAMKNKKGRIQGEIYEVDDQTLKMLDRLESHPVWYKRQLFKVGKYKVWIYLNPEEAKDLPIIPNGNWNG